MTAFLSLTDEQRMLTEAVGTIADKYGHSYYSERGRRGDHLTELWADLGNAGFLGVGIPEAYGGGGGGLTDLTVVLEELAAHGLPLFMGLISPGICGSILTAHGSEEQRTTWLPGTASGERILAFAITEADAGSNTHRLTTTARPDGDDWVLNGAKCFISGADQADAVIVVARTGTETEPDRGRLSLFVVPADSAGLRISPIPLELVSPDRQFELFFDDVRVPGGALIGVEGRGMQHVFAGLNPERILVAALANGIGRYALDRAADYARTRQVWSTPVGAHQGIAHPLAAAHIEVQLARLATLHAAKRHDGGGDSSEAANVAKYAAAEAALHALDQAIQTHGGNGLTTEYGLADLWFVARLMRTAPVSREMILNFVAQHSLALPRSY